MPKRPRDPVQLAKQVFDIAIGEAEDTVCSQSNCNLIGVSNLEDQRSTTTRGRESRISTDNTW